MRGAIVLRAMQYQKRLQAGATDLPFKKVIYCNIGNPQSLGQKPITFHRQVLALMDYPDLIDNPAAASIFPKDVIARAKVLRKSVDGGTGAYSESQGLWRYAFRCRAACPGHGRVPRRWVLWL